MAGDDSAPRTAQVSFTEVGSKDNMPYQIIDFSRACRISGKVALSFYQIDYQAMVNALVEQDGETAARSYMPVAKLVMSMESFNELREELDRLAAKIEAADKADE